MLRVFVVVVAVTSWLATATSAWGSSLTTAGEARVADVADLLYAGGTTSTRPVPVSPATLESWRAEELRTYGSGQGPHVEIENLRRASRLKWGLRILGRASLVATVGQVYWEVGSILADEIYEDELPSSPPLPGWEPTFREVFAVQKGDCIQLAGWPVSWGPPTRATVTNPDGSCSVGGGLSSGASQPETLRAPSDGWVLSFRALGGAQDYYTVQFGPGPEGDLSSRLRSGYSASHYSTCRQTVYPLVGGALPGFQLIGATTASGTPWAKQEQTKVGCNPVAFTPQIITGRPYVWFKPAAGSARPLESSDSPLYGPFAGSVPDPGRLSVESAVRDNLCSLAFRGVADFVARQTGTAVCLDQPSPIELPSCRGRTYDQCRSDLEDQGLSTRRVTRTVEQVPDEDIELGAGTVVSTAPAAGRFAMPGDDVEVATNPERVLVEVNYSETEDRDCDFGPRGTYPPEWDVQGSGLEFAAASTFLLPPGRLGTDENVDGQPAPVVLRQGTLTWGRLKIAEKHGWNAATERDTRLAIAFGYRYATSNGEFPGSRDRDYTIALPQRNAAGKLCGRRVSAQLAYKSTDPDFMGELREKGIITSFGVRIVP